MHKLDRASVEEPACLATYHHNTHAWDKVTGKNKPVILSEDKRVIRDKLKEMQGNRCAYCEGSVYSNAHIEHFRRKNKDHFPELTFDWSNLFLSCESWEHCGHYKDRPKADPYNPSDLIKPDEQDPDIYFYFHSSGEVRPRSGLNSNQEHLANETIRVFNLNEPALKALRKRAIEAYKRRNPNILNDLMEWNETDRQEYIRAEIDRTSKDPYWTVIRHFFEKL